MVPLFSLPDSYLLGMAAWLALGFAALVVCLKLRRRWRPAPKKRRWTSLALSLWFFLAALTLVELGFALFVDRTDSFSNTNISLRWFDLHVRRNEAGYRDEHPFSRKREAGERRLYFAGDSFTFGHGVEVEERFSDRIAAELESRAPGTSLVTNAAEIGFGANDIAEKVVPQILRTAVPGDVVVYTLVLNDIEHFDAERTAAFYRTVDSLKPSCFLFRDTYFLNLLWYRLAVLSQPEVRDYYGFLRESYESDAWQRMARTLDEMIDECRSRGVELRVVLFPFLHNLGPDYPFANVHEQLSEFFKSREVRCLDLRPVLEPHASERLTVNASDAHPSFRAHELAARAILDNRL